jgi:hypothetical protein
MDIEHEQNRRYSENTDRLYFCLVGLGVCSVGVLWSRLVMMFLN